MSRRMWLWLLGGCFVLRLFTAIARGVEWGQSGDWLHGFCVNAFAYSMDGLVWLFIYAAAFIFIHKNMPKDD